MASPTPTSAAATAITNRAKTCPATVLLKAPKAIRLMLTAFRISSTDMRTSTLFLRARAPYTPVQNKKAARIRNSLSCMRRSSLVPPGDHDGADQRRQEEDGGHFEGDDEVVEDGDPDRGGVAPPVGDQGGVYVDSLETPLQGDRQHAEEEQGDDPGQPPLVVVQLLVAAERRPGEEQAEQHQDHDGADVHQHLG